MSETRPIMSGGQVSGTFRVPGSKSLTNRALVCAALAKGRSILRNASDSSDSALMVNGLNQLGVLVRRDRDQWHVDGTGGVLFAPRFPIPVGNAGTTLRFFLALAAVAKGTVVFEGSPRMGKRPNRELIDALRQAGIDAREDPGLSRYEVTGGFLPGGRLTVRQDRSSQFLTALLLVAPMARTAVELHIDGPRRSESYVRMTVEVMRAFRVEVQEDRHEGDLRISAPQQYSPAEFAIEPDASGASYGLAAAAITGGDIVVPGLRSDSLQGDAGFPSLLARMGCVIEETAGGIRLKGPPLLSGIDVDMSAMPDAVPTLAAVALFAETATRIRNVAHLRYKESDRIGALVEEFRKLGGSIVEYDDGLEIIPVPLHGGVVATYEDHRMAMTAALIGLRVSGVEVEDPGCVVKSFPRFWEEFDALCSSDRSR